MAWKSDSPEYSFYTQPSGPPPKPADTYCCNCGKKYGFSARFCAACARARGKISLIKDLIPTQCGKCTESVEADDNYCGHCSTPVDKSWKDVPACSCGTLLESNAQYCGSCGKPANGKRKEAS